jgi:hypothetical protein
LDDPQEQHFNRPIPRPPGKELQRGFPRRRAVERRGVRRVDGGGRYSLSGHNQERSGGVSQHLFRNAAVQPPIESVALMAGHNNQVRMFRPSDVDNSLCRVRGTQLNVGLDAFAPQRTNQLR